MSKNTSIKISIGITILITALIFACGGESESLEPKDQWADPYDDAIHPDDTTDRIIIKQTTPDSDLTDDTDINFNVIVEYSLYSEQSAMLNIGFNTTNAGSFDLIEAAEKSITSGHGYHIFLISVTVNDWGDADDFQVFVNMTQEVSDGPSIQLAYDKEELSFE